MLKIKKSVIVLIISSLTLALLGGGQIPYLVFYMVSGVFIISYLWTAFTARKISVFQRVENKDYYVGDIITIQSYIDNDTLLPIPYVEIIDHTTDGMADNNPRPTIISMMPIERELVKSNVTIKYRGIYDIGPLELKISDVFGAFAWNRSVYTNTYVKVYPKVHRIVNFNLKSMQSFGTMSTKNKAYEDNTSISDIRKYNIGDSVKKIHWKVTAKKGSLHVKDYQMTGSTSIHILLDLKKNCYKRGNSKILEERAVEAAASLSWFFLSNSVSVNMYVNALKLHYIRGRDIKEFKNFQEIFCEVTSDGYNSLKDVLEKRIKLIARGSSLIIITGDLGSEDARAFEAIKEMGYDIVLIFISDEELEDDIKSVLSNSEIRMYFVTSESDIKGVLESK